LLDTFILILTDNLDPDFSDPTPNHGSRFRFLMITMAVWEVELKLRIFSKFSKETWRTL